MSINDLIHTNAHNAFEQGKLAEQQRIIKLLEEESRNCEKAGLWANGPDLREQLQELHLGLNAAIALIKDESKMIHSEILPDGTIYIEEIKGEQK